MAIVKDEFPDDHELRNVQFLRKWVSSPNTLVHGLRKPDLLVLPVDLADKMAEKPITFEEIATSCEVKYTASTSLRSSARMQTSEIALFCMWKQVDRSYYLAFSLCSSLLTIFQYTRGGARVSPPVDIDLHPELFIRLLLTISVGDSLWLGYDPWVTDMVIENCRCKQVTLHGNRVEFPGDGDIKPVEVTTFTLIRPIFMAYGLKGRGTRIWLAEDAQHRYYILKDCWLPRTWANDITLHRLLQDKSREDAEFAVEVRGNDYAAIFGEEDSYHVFDNPLFEEIKYDGALNGIPTLVCWDEVQRSNGSGTPVPETTRMLLGLPPTVSIPEGADFEDRLHLRAAFAECGIGIAWFSCAREFFNAMMGVLVGMFPMPAMGWTSANRILFARPFQWLRP